VGSERASVRARVAIHGANLEALTGDDTVRVPLAGCSLESEGRKTLVRDRQGSLVIWSDDDGFLHALERAQRGILARQVRTLQAAARRRILLKWGISAAVAMTGVAAAALPVTRWAVGGGIPWLENRIGESTLERLTLPAETAPEVDGALGTIAEQLRPMTAPSTRPFRLVLADYSEVHSFSLPPNTVVVTAGLVCAADAPQTVTAVVARELAHLERHDVSKRIAGTVRWSTAFDLARGDVSTLRARMLDFADPERCPGFTPEQQAAAEQRAKAMVTATAAVRMAGVRTGLDWSHVREEACKLIGR
jgi:hypothetical protein